MPYRAKASRLSRLSLALLVAIQYETESTLSRTFLLVCALRIEHLAGRDEVGDDVDFGVVEMERLAVDLAVHLWVGKEYLGRAALGDNRQHSRFLKLLDGLRGENHRRVVLPPRLLSRHDVGADGLVLDEEPRLVQQKHLEGRELRGVRNLIARPMKDIEQQRLQHLRSIAPAGEVEGLEAGKAERVFYVVEEEAVLPLLASNGAAAPSTRR